MIDAHFAAKVDSLYEAAFATKFAEPKREMPNFAPVSLKGRIYKLP